jgi:tetratricopeptide (TPR) repeat protein
VSGLQAVNDRFRKVYLRTNNLGRFPLAGNHALIPPSSLHLFYVRQFPRLVDEWLVRAVETEKRKPAATGHGLNPELAVLENALGECYKYQREFEQAISHFQRAYDALANGQGESITLRARVSIGLAESFIGQEQPRLATKILQREEDTISIGSKKKPRVDASFQTALGDLAAVEKQFDHAIPHYKNAIMIFVTSIGAEHPNRFWPEISFAEAAIAIGDEVDAREHFLVAQGLAKRFFDPASFAAGRVVNLSSRFHLM